MGMKDKILELREQGKSYGEIKNIIGCSKSTVAYYCGKRMCLSELSGYKDKVKQRKIDKICSCGGPKDYRAKVCKKCREYASDGDWREMTIGEKVYDKHKYAKYSFVRYYARKVALEIYDSKCTQCEYDLHVECCHIKAISDFSPDTKLKVVNDPSNLVLLCPNCHWEFDNLKWSHEESNPIQPC